MYQGSRGLSDFNSLKYMAWVVEGSYKNMKTPGKLLFFLVIKLGRICYRKFWETITAEFAIEEHEYWLYSSWHWMHVSFEWEYNFQIEKCLTSSL